MPTKSPAKRTAAKKAAPVRKAAPAKKATPAKKIAPVKKTVPAKKAAPVKKAAAVIASVDKVKKAAPQGPQHRVYVIEVRHLKPGITWDYYVGYTNNFYKVRWEKYMDLVPNSVSRFFTEKKVEALEYRYDLMKGWGPYATKAEGLTAEGDLALYLEDQGYRVYSDQLKYAKARRKEGAAMMTPRVPKKRSARRRATSQG